MKEKDLRILIESMKDNNKELIPSDGVYLVVVKFAKQRFRNVKFWLELPEDFLYSKREEMI